MIVTGARFVRPLVALTCHGDKGGVVDTFSLSGCAPTVPAVLGPTVEGDGFEIVGFEVDGVESAIVELGALRVCTKRRFSRAPNATPTAAAMSTTVARLPNNREFFIPAIHTGTPAQVWSRLVLWCRRLRTEPIQVAREQRDLADVGGAGEAGDPAFESDGEAAVRRHAVAERLEVAGERREVVAVERGDVVVVAVQPLAAGDELEASEQQVEAVRRSRVGPGRGGCRTAA